MCFNDACSCKESKAREIRFKDISPEAFDVMLRSSCHLDPKLTPERALATLTAASLYLIEELEALCREYLEQIQEIPLILKTLTAATKLGHAFPCEVQRKFWIAILLNSQETVQSLASAEAHGSIVEQLIKLDELEIDEELLWGSLVDWVAAAVRKPEILGPFADITLDSTKRPRTAASGTCGGRGANERAQQEAILRLMSKHLRLGAISKEFFARSVKQYLAPEDREAVFLHFLVGDKLEHFSTSKRTGLVPVESVVPKFVWASSVHPSRLLPPEEQPFINGNSSWLPTSGDYLSVRLLRKVCLSRVVLTFSPGQWIEKCYLRMKPGEDMTFKSWFEGCTQIVIPTWACEVEEFKIIPGLPSIDLLGNNCNAPLIDITATWREMCILICSTASSRGKQNHYIDV